MAGILRTASVFLPFSVTRTVGALSRMRHHSIHVHNTSIESVLCALITGDVRTLASHVCAHLLCNWRSCCLL